MTYRATRESTTLTFTQIREEALKILVDMGLRAKALDEDCPMQVHERNVILQNYRNLQRPDFELSVKILWWLRDLKDKYV